MKVWIIVKTLEREPDDYDYGYGEAEPDVVHRDTSEAQAKAQLGWLWAGEHVQREAVSRIEGRCARLFAAVSSPRLQWVLTRGGKYTAGSHYRDTIRIARRAVFQRLFGRSSPPPPNRYELRGPFDVESGPEPRTYTEDQLRTACNASCTCGGGGPDDCCPACAVWHWLGAGP